MHTTSRREKREESFDSLAKQGKMSCNDVFLYKSEARNLIKQGLYVERHGTNEKEQLPSIVSWENSFENGIPLLAIDYIKGITVNFPHSEVKNWAQELYVIASRANYKKAQTANE